MPMVGDSAACPQSRQRSQRRGQSMHEELLVHQGWPLCGGNYGGNYYFVILTMLVLQCLGAAM